jgi:hypothetical protein
MFDGDLTTLSTADLLESAAEHRAEANRVDARLFEHAQVFADRHHPDRCPSRPGRRPWDGRERAVVLGGDGCPEIAEFAVAEFGLMLGISPGVAAGYIGQALALRHRFPFLWARVRSGEATPWRAGKIATFCVNLSEEAARYVDKRVAPIVDSITPYRLEKIVKAAKMHADPEAARAEAEEKARERGVFVGRTDEDGTKTMYIRASSGGVIRLDASIASVADALKILGDTRSLHQRRADAVEIVADPHYMIELLLQAHEHSLTHTPDVDHSTTPPATPPTPTTDEAEAAAHHAGQAPPSDRVTAPAGRSDEDLLNDWMNERGEPGPDDEADRDAPHPSDTQLTDPLDAPSKERVEPLDSMTRLNPEDGEPLDAAARHALHDRLAQIKQRAHTNPTTSRGTGGARGRLRPGKTEIYVHLTDHSLSAGTGVLRVEDLGPLLAEQLAELVGHGPYVVKPVIDLNDAVSVDAYEIPDRIRERVKLTHPVELFPYGTRETHATTDLDHIQPYDPLGPPGQTTTRNLAPLGRFTHRVKTHGPGWKVRRVDPRTLEWTTPQGFTFRVDPTGTHRVLRPDRSTDPS